MRRTGLLGKLYRFAREDEGSIAVIFSIALIPIVLAVGAATDYSRASAIRTSLQAALDSAILTAARNGGTDWADLAQRTLNATFPSKDGTATSSFQQTSTEVYKGSASVTVPTRFLGIMHLTSLTVSVTSTGTAAGPDDSCILTLDHGQPSSHVALSLNGAPIVNLSGCSIRSNSSIDCNGHDGNVTRAVAAGTAGACAQPSSNVSPVPDVYAPLANNISTQCGSSRPGATWTPGSPPLAGMITVDKGTFTEYHVCGNLQISGTGYLTGSAPTQDTVIVIENGSLTIADGSNISSTRTAIVMTGNNSYASAVNFPNGNGKSATLSLSAPTDSTNPWQGVALFQDPKLTYGVDDSWGPGANFNADGLVYLGNANVVTDGNTGSSNSKCSKFVMNSFTTNGKVNLDLQQQVAACSAIGLKQWGGVVVHLMR